MSKDGGSTFTKLDRGLPAGPLGKIGLAVAPSNPKRVYALIATPGQGQGNLWRSDDGGANWKLTSSEPGLNSRAVYFSRMAVLPDNPDEVYFLTQATRVSRDGGATVRVIREVYVDQHDIWVDPLDAKRIIIANDRYINISRNRGKSWFHIDLPNGQLYRVATDQRVPYNVYGNRHDGPGFRGPSNSRASSTGGGGGGGITPHIDGDLWEWVGGTEVGWSIPDPDDNDFVWAMDASRILVVNTRNGSERAVTPWPRRAPMGASLSSGDAIRLGGGFAFHISPHTPRRVYAGSQYVHQTMDRGRTWTVISPDLTANVLRPPTGPWPDGPVASALFSIAESPLERGVIWAGSTDGLVHVTRDGGGQWTNVTPSTLGIPAPCVVSSIEPSPHVAGVAYLTVDCHRTNNRVPHVARTADYGKTWTSIAATVPRSVVSYARVIREDPRRRGMLYLGTEAGLYVSVDDGGRWIPMRNGLPPAPVSWITVQAQYDDLVISTFGRGFWIMDDITPMQQLTPAVVARESHLFAPRAAYALAGRGPKTAQAIATEFDTPTNTGRNPPVGASLSYWLKSAESGPVRITIAGRDGKVIRTLEGTSTAGINRVWWDLRGEAAPPAASGGQRAAPAVVAPGTYSVRLTVRGVEHETRLVVLADPAEGG
jgi:hypothetical protein